VREIPLAIKEVGNQEVGNQEVGNQEVGNRREAAEMMKAQQREVKARV